MSSPDADLPGLIPSDEEIATKVTEYKKIIAQLESDGLYDSAYQIVQKVKHKYGVDIPLDKDIYNSKRLPMLSTADLMVRQDYNNFYDFDNDIPGADLDTTPILANTANTDVDADRVKTVSNFAYKKLYEHVNSGLGTVDHVVFSQEGLYYAVLHTNANNRAHPDYHLTFNSLAKIYQAHQGTSTASHAANVNTFRANHGLNIKPAVRTYSDHQHPLGHVEFHPTEPFIVSCSGRSIRFHDHSRNAEQTAFRQLVLPGPVNSFAVHPAGEHMVVAGDTALLSLYDLRSFEAYVNPAPRGPAEPASALQWAYTDGVAARHPNARPAFGDAAAMTDDAPDAIPGLSGPRRLPGGGVGLERVGGPATLGVSGLHTKTITGVAYSGDGSMVVSCSKDGSVRLWDGRDLSLVRTLHHASGVGTPTQVMFSPSCQYVLIYGTDGCVSVVDVMSGQLVYRCAGLGNPNGTGQCGITSDGKYVVATDDTTCGISFFDSTNGELIRRITQLHSKPIISLSLNPTHDGILTGSLDNRYTYLSGNDSFDF